MLNKIKIFLSLIIIIHFVLGISCRKENPECVPASCGNIRNISTPFRLKDDPKHCGNPNYELTCENNTTILYFSNSQRYLVQTIHYSNYTIRLTDPSMRNDNCSFPNYSLSPTNFRLGYPYDTTTYINSSYVELTRSITFMSCPYPVNNSLLLETTHDCSDESNKRRTYIKYGELNGSYVMDKCTIELMAMTSLQIEDEKSVSLSDIHSSLLYGFELSWHMAFCGGSCSCFFDGKTQTCSRGRPYYRCYATYHWVWVLQCDGYVPAWINWTLWILRFIVYGVPLNLLLRILIGMPCMLGLLIHKLRRRHLSTFDTIEGFLQSNNNLMSIRYSYSDLNKMTRHFREKLGEGGYGSVYKGKLRSGRYVAVKVISNPKSNGQDFINEVATIGRIHHVNVVKLVGYCVERSKYALVYDFMPKSSLERYIFSRERSNLISWERKYEIAIGVARGIEYLHKGCDIQILHFDIKPHNILLDENFIPKISDFGLAKFYSIEKNALTLTAARGTIGYVAPELINRSIGEVSCKADVYSFGMLLMEMVGLKRNNVTDYDKSSRYFPYWIYDMFEKGKDIELGNVDEINDDDDDNEYARKVVKKMTIVGLWCIQMSPVHRPSMNEVLKMLEGQNEHLHIPPRPSRSPQIECHNDDQTWGTEWSSSLTLLGRDASSRAVSRDMGS